jgi:hypothetical protein
LPCGLLVLGDGFRENRNVKRSAVAEFDDGKLHSAELRSSMWKASIDGLEPLLGKTYEAGVNPIVVSTDGRIWNPQDGRVVRLGLPQTVDYSLGQRRVDDSRRADRPMNPGQSCAGWRERSPTSAR